MSQLSSTLWEPLNPDSLVSAPCLIEQTLCQANGDDQPQLAGTVEYAQTILEAWREREAADGGDWKAQYQSIVYEDSEGTRLYGHLIRSTDTDSHAENGNSLPTIVLFHTGAGPHDLFLLQQAACLVHTFPTHQVVVADLLGDESGWAWNVDDRTRYNHVRTQLLAIQEDKRPVLRSRLSAVLQQYDVRAALGWCLGGHAITELAGIPASHLCALVTFHGVFGNLEPILAFHQTQKQRQPQAVEVLICHGIHDPFVPDNDLEHALQLFQTLGCTCSLLQLEARHGFTNPAQVHNTNPAFAYNTQAAEKAWRQAVALLRRRLL